MIGDDVSCFGPQTRDMRQRQRGLKSYLVGLAVVDSPVVKVGGESHGRWRRQQEGLQIVI